MTRRAWGAIGTMITAMTLAAGLTLSGTIGSHPAATCHLTQPVYSGTVRVGTWNATLHQGQTVTLPDGDTATCTGHEQVTVR